MSAEITDRERQLVTELRASVSQSHHLPPGYETDFNLLRWVRAYANEDEEENMIGDCAGLLRCQLTMLETMVQLEGTDTDARISAECAPLSILGDNGGDSDNRRIVIVDRLGRYDVNGLMKAIRPTPFVVNRVRTMEKVLRLVNVEEERTKKMAGVVVIFDLDGLQFDTSLLGILTGVFINMWGILGRMYPGLISKFLIINAHSYMNLVWAAMTPFLSDQIKENIVITDHHWKQQLLEYISPERLPVEFGGTMTGPNGDEACFQLIPLPVNLVPEELYWSPKAEEPEMKDLTELLVAAGTYRLLSFEICEANTIINLFLQCDQVYGFGIFYTDDKKELSDTSEMEMLCLEHAQLVVPATCDNVRFRCPKAGVYHLKFGNEAAWIYSVTVNYWLGLIGADGNVIEEVKVLQNADQE